MQEAWLESKVVLVVKRTKKAFLNYNEYLDRPFGLKWGTAYAMDGVTRFLTSALEGGRAIARSSLVGGHAGGMAGIEGGSSGKAN